MEYTAVKMNKVQLHATTWMNPSYMILCEKHKFWKLDRAWHHFHQVQELEN